MAENPYAPPNITERDRHQAPPVGSFDDEELERLVVLARPHAVTKAAAALQAALGALLLLGALQLADVVRLFGWLRWVPHLMTILGIASLWIALKVYRLRLWATLAALIGSAIIALLMAGWFLLAASSGFLSLIGLLIPVSALAAAIVSSVALGACHRARDARKRLAEGGVPVDF
ncbi:MAG: hypothetical protein H6707_06625 [Deltaproteobacteria bacterium]|nr:hypothetical protein [Deltaproteobacteria bacterium]